MQCDAKWPGPNGSNVRKCNGLRKRCSSVKQQSSNVAMYQSSNIRLRKRCSSQCKVAMSELMEWKREENKSSQYLSIHIGATLYQIYCFIPEKGTQFFQTSVSNFLNIVSDQVFVEKKVLISDLSECAMTRQGPRGQS